MKKKLSNSFLLKVDKINFYLIISLGKWYDLYNLVRPKNEMVWKMHSINVQSLNEYRDC